MRGLVVEKNGIVHLADDIPMPEIGPYEALVKIECCMICNGTDVEIIKGELTEWGGICGKERGEGVQLPDRRPGSAGVSARLRTLLQRLGELL